ncbi:MAG: rod-binding protein [Boseongicola sp.]|nr:rod-binding protein [Boseongicola sp.]
MISQASPDTTVQVRLATGHKHPELWKLSQSLEATFLSEMLKTAGLGKVSDTFGGGIGEEQFSSFLNQQRADAMVDKGGIGLAESIYQSLTGQDSSHVGR